MCPVRRNKTNVTVSDQKRAEIAAMILAGIWAYPKCPGGEDGAYMTTCEELAQKAVEQTDALIAALGYERE